MAVPKELVELLRCPCDTHSEIEYKERRQVILCNECTAVFPVRENIPGDVARRSQAPARPVRDQHG